MTQAVLELASQLQDKLKTLTVDYGKESLTIRQLNGKLVLRFILPMLIHHMERGSNENRNRVLRRVIPKGQAIEELSDRQLVQINWYLNSRHLNVLTAHTNRDLLA